jgi:hypothetical protein
MNNGIGPEPQNSPQPTSTVFVTPEADIVVFAGDASNRVTVPLNRLRDGVSVIAAGTVTDIREHGSVDAPRATLQLINDFGQATYAAADTDVLAEYGLFLMDGVPVSLHGVARQPFAEDPRTTYVQIVRVEPLVD